MVFLFVKFIQLLIFTNLFVFCFQFFMHLFIIFHIFELPPRVAFDALFSGASLEGMTEAEKYSAFCSYTPLSQHLQSLPLLHHIFFNPVNPLYFNFITTLSLLRDS